MEPLAQGASLRDIQNYVKLLETERGFSELSITAQALKFGSEAGEVLDAVAALDGQPQDPQRRVADLGAEAVDALIMLMSVVNRAGIDLEDAFRQKEAVNNARVWQ